MASSVFLASRFYCHSPVFARPKPTFWNSTLICEARLFPLRHLARRNVTGTVARRMASCLLSLPARHRANRDHWLDVLFLSARGCGPLRYQGSRDRVREVDGGAVVSRFWHANDKRLTLQSRALIVDGRVKEYMLGAPHEVTDRLFVVRRMFRVNDSLPEESSPC